MLIDGTELVRIIKACRQAGVSTLKHGELELSFHFGEPVKTERPVVDSTPPPTDQELKEAHEAAELVQELEREDEDLATMQIEDPQRFEELLVEREFTFGDEAL